jgi:putative drug exporter of the RND superfamily
LAEGRGGAGDGEPPARWEGIGRLVTRRPRRVVAVWLLLVMALALAGLGLDDKLSVRPILLEGTASKQGYDVAMREFGGENAMVVLLRGPHASVERQGRRLERRLDAMPGALVISPWDSGGAIDGLMPAPGVAGIVVSVPDPSGEDLVGGLESLRQRIATTVESPVRASVAGTPAIADATMGATDRAVEWGERIAMPLLLIVLLLVFRSVVAAAIPLLIGGSVVLATRGVLDFLLGLTAIDAFALGAAGMMGLALGVDYSLLVVSRFREEVAAGADRDDAALRTIATSGPTVTMAGGGLSLAMLTTSLLLPGTIVTSVAIAVVSASVLSVLSAVLVVPAFLVLLGPRLELLSLPRRQGGKGRALRWTTRLSKRPRLVVLPVVFLLLAGTLWSFTLDTGIVSVKLLPPGDLGRRQHEDVQRALGPGWVAPYEIVMDGGSSPVTTPQRLRALADFQRRVERDPGVATMAGLAGIDRAAQQLAALERGLAAQNRGLDRLGYGLSRAHDGATLNTSGLLRAADGARQLDSAIGAARSGATLLADGLGVADSGSARLAGGLDRAREGSAKVANGAASASAGAARLAAGLDRAREQTGAVLSSARVLENAMSSGDRRLTEVDASVEAAVTRLATALSALRAMTSGRSDPRYGEALAAAEGASASLTGVDPGSGEATSSSGVTAGVESARGQFSLGLYLSKRLDKSGRKATDGITKLARGSARLDRGLERLATGSRAIDGGIARLAVGGRELPSGLGRLGSGAEQLASGLDRIHGGSAGLAAGLGGGAQKSELLTGALDKIQAGVKRQGGKGLGGATAGSGDLFRSGYFYLAGLDGSSPERRAQAGFLVSLDRGGRAARMLVIPRHDPSADGAQETRLRLEDEADGLASDTGTSVFVGGATPLQLDADSAYRGQSPLTRLALALVTFLILVPVLRSLTVPLAAAILNVLTVAATFGFLALVFDGSLLGGPGFVDTSVIPATIMMIFGLAIDYEVFIFARMREEYERTGSVAAAIDNGLERTAPVVTGAAMIMIVVFLAFATSSFFTIRGFGVAQAVAVAIDAFLIRLIVIPALMRALGRWAWWMPRWLDRLLPGRPVAVPAVAKGAVT